MKDARKGFSELAEAVKLANRILDRPGGDPDDDLAVLSRHLLRTIEQKRKAPPKVTADLPLIVEHLEHAIAWTRDMSKPAGYPVTMALQEAVEALSTPGVAVMLSPGESAAVMVCDKEQLSIWSNEFAEHLLPGSYVRLFTDWEDKIAFFSAIEDAIEDLVAKAFTHPALDQDEENLPGQVQDLVKLLDKAAATCPLRAKAAVMLRKVVAYANGMQRLMEYQAQEISEDVVLDIQTRARQRDRIIELEGTLEARNIEFDRLCENKDAQIKALQAALDALGSTSRTESQRVRQLEAEIERLKNPQSPYDDEQIAAFDLNEVQRQMTMHAIIKHPTGNVDMYVVDDKLPRLILFQFGADGVQRSRPLRTRLFIPA